MLIVLIERALDDLEQRKAVAEAAGQPAETPQLQVACMPDPDQPRQMQFVVTDNGIGFESDQASDLFAQAHSHKTKRLGMGLHQAQTEANRMNGQLTGLSMGVEQGARFVLTVPHQVENNAQAA